MKPREVAIGDLRLPGLLTTPDSVTGVVVFAHGSGSSRLSPRNQYVAGTLHSAGLGTLLFDLLTDAEAADRANVFDIELLAGRLRRATEWLDADIPVGYFGASTGAAAALVAAADLADEIGAVVSRGGRPDLALARLPEVVAPTLLIVGGNDTAVIEMNRTAQAALTCSNRIDIVPGAGHLFEEPGTLEKVAMLARDWFLENLSP
jgi:putative phosphoribosyl transferase